MIYRREREMLAIVRRGRDFGTSSNAIMKNPVPLEELIFWANPAAMQAEIFTLSNEIREATDRALTQKPEYSRII
jgi:hypothetical protein